MLNDVILLIKNVGQQLSMFGQRKEVQRPGIRGGKFYYSKKDHKVRYGERPEKNRRIGPKHIPPGQMLLFHSEKDGTQKGTVLAHGSGGATVQREDGKREQVKHEQIAALHPEKTPDDETRVIHSYTRSAPGAKEKLSVSKEEKAAIDEDGGYRFVYYSPYRPLSFMGLDKVGRVAGGADARFLFTKERLPLQTVVDYELT